MFWKDLLVNIDGNAFVTTDVQNQTLIPTHGPDILRRPAENISADMIQGNTLTPNDHAAPNIMIAAVAALPPATVLTL